MAKTYVLNRIVLVGAILLWGVGCQTVSHETIDTWSTTEKGPGKLLEVVRDSDSSVDLRSHAAQNLIHLGEFSAVEEVLNEMEEQARYPLVADLADRLWKDARINQPMDVPNARQTNAKDALFNILDLGDEVTSARTTEYLAEWFLGGHYEGRAKSGRVTGAMFVRKVGAAIEERLLNTARQLVAAPPDAEGRRNRVGDQLLKALALSDSAEALKFMTELIGAPRGDATLPGRVMAALHFAFVEPAGLPPAEGKALLAISEVLRDVFYANKYSGTMRNDALGLLEAIGAPDCIGTFTTMVNRPGPEERYLWMGVQHGIRCAGVQGIEAITEAIPTSGNYQRSMLSKYLWDEIAKLQDRDGILVSAKHMLQSKHWVARITAIEVLGQMGDRDPDLVSRIEQLKSDSRRLKNWYGKQGTLPPSERKVEPTLGEVAMKVVANLKVRSL